VGFDAKNLPELAPRHDPEEVFAGELGRMQHNHVFGRLGNGAFPPGEVTLGLAQLLGRVRSATSATANAAATSAPFGSAGGGSDRSSKPSSNAAAAAAPASAIRRSAASASARISAPSSTSRACLAS
jgi:hypothetical protein